MIKDDSEFQGDSVYLDWIDLRSLLWWPSDGAVGARCEALLLWLTIGITGESHCPLILLSFCPPSEWSTCHADCCTSAFGCMRAQQPHRKLQRECSGELRFD
jgi:hypothetical protein